MHQGFCKDETCHSRGFVPAGTLIVRCGVRCAVCGVRCGSFVYDVNNLDSFRDLGFWADLLVQHGMGDVCTVVVGHKTRLHYIIWTLSLGIVT